MEHRVSTLYEKATERSASLPPADKLELLEEWIEFQIDEGKDLKRLRKLTEEHRALSKTVPVTGCVSLIPIDRIW